MKHHHNHLLAAHTAVIAIAIAIAGSAQAQTNYDWNGDGADDSWGTADNWSTGSQTWNVNAIARFHSLGARIPTTIITGGARSMRELRFNANAVGPVVIDISSAGNMNILTSPAGNSKITVIAGADGDFEIKASGTGGVVAAKGSTGVGRDMTIEHNGTGTLLISAKYTQPETLYKEGTGTLELTGNNTGFTGSAVIDGGKIFANGAGALANVSGITINDGGTLQISNTGDVVGNSTNVIVNSGGIFDVAKTDIIGGLSGEGNVNIVALPYTLTVGGGDATSSFSGAISSVSGGAIAKTGTGTLTLSGPNTYNGTTSVNEGVLRVENSAGLGSADGGTSVANNAALVLAGGISLADALTITGGGVGGSGAILSDAGENTVSGDIAMGPNQTRIGASSACTLILTGAISGTPNLGAIKVGFGTVVFAGANTFSTGINLNAGSVRIGVDSVGSVDDITSSFAGTGTLRLTGPTLTSDGTTPRTILNAVNIAGNPTLGAANTYTGALTFEGDISLNGAARTLTVNSEVTMAGALGNGALTKAGAGTLTLSGTNSYTGDTTVNGGTLVVTNPNFAATSTITIAASGVLDLPNPGTHTVEALVLAGNPQPDGIYDAANSGDLITGDGRIEVGGTTGSDYDDWVALFAPGFTDTAPTSDPDGDGLDNFTEYAFGLNPVSGASVSPITSPLSGSQFTYTRRATTGLAYKVFTSTNLATWTEDTAAIQVPGTPDGNGVQSVTVTVTATPLNGRLFVRIEASE